MRARQEPQDDAPPPRTRNAADRDAQIKERYRKRPSLVPDDDLEEWQRSPLAWIGAHISQLADAFLEARAVRRGHPDDSLSDLCAVWLERELGHAERVAVGMIVAEAKLYVVNAKGFALRTGLPCGPFATRREEERWCAAVARAGPRGSRRFEQYLRAVCSEAGAELGDALSLMEATTPGRKPSLREALARLAVESARADAAERALAEARSGVQP